MGIRITGGTIVLAVAAIAPAWALQAGRVAEPAPPSIQDRASSSPARTVWDGVYTAPQQKRGEPVYVRECSTCHGETLKGGEGSPPLTGVDFAERWNGRTLGDLFQYIRSTMPPPPDTPGRLTPEQDADVMAYILSVNRFPAGTAGELAADVERLRQIRITFTRDQ